MSGKTRVNTMRLFFPLAFLTPSCLVFIGIIASKVSQLEASCLRLIGIESGGGQGALDLDDLIVNLEINTFSIGRGNPTIGSCLAALETPVAMRQVLGELPTEAPISIEKTITIYSDGIQYHVIGKAQHGIRLESGLNYASVYWSPPVPCRRYNARHDALRNHLPVKCPEAHPSE